MHYVAVPYHVLSFHDLGFTHTTAASDFAVTLPYGSAFCNVFVKFICQSFIFMVFVIAISFPSTAFEGALLH